MGFSGVFFVFLKYLAIFRPFLKQTLGLFTKIDTTIEYCELRSSVDTAVSATV